MVVWRVFGNSEMAWFVVELWMTGDETERSFARRWVFPVPSLLSGPGGNSAVPDKSDGIELYHPSSTVLRTV